jgi:hypothetical protein
MTEQEIPTTPQEKCAYWQRHIDQWQQSGLSQIEYCRRNQIKKYQWGYWKKRLTTPKSPAMLVPVTIPSQSASCLRVVVDNHIAIEIPTGFDPATLTKVIACLTRR